MLTMNTMNTMKRVLVAFGMMALAATAQAAERLKPFVLSEVTAGGIAQVQPSVETKLTDAGFEIVGSYSPYDGAKVIGITSDALRKAAAQSEFGGYGAVQRVALTERNGEVQVSYTDPIYMSHAYRMKGDLSGVAAALRGALGAKQSFGPGKGLSADDLHDYHYMFGMPYFDDALELATHDTYDAAVSAVEAKLAAVTGGVTKVWRVDIPGKEETIFGVGLKMPKNGNKYMDDNYIMSEIDFKELRSTAHLPYEVLVSGNRVYALPAEFRIAINFPDLSMMGANSFMNIMQSPDAIQTALTAVAGGGSSGSASGFGF